MADRLPIPEDLQHLIEKRDADDDSPVTNDRRRENKKVPANKERRSGVDRRQSPNRKP